MRQIFKRKDSAIESLLKSREDKDLEEEMYAELRRQLPPFYDGDLDEETFFWTAKVVLKLVRRMIWFYVDDQREYTDQSIEIAVKKEDPNIRY